jgi:protein LTV1
MVRKKFIDKKSATTYSLVYRSTDGCDDDDGAAAEALASARVLAADGADRVLVAQPRAGEAGPGPSSSGRHAAPPTQDPRALYRHFFGGDDDDEGGPANGKGLSEAKRRELLSMGFPDDGYDYLKHMRAVGAAGGGQQQRQAAAAAAEAAAAAAADDGEQVVETVGPATFLRAPRLRAPAPDVKLVDARGVRTKAGVPGDAEAEEQDAQAGGGDLSALEREMRAVGLGGAARAQLPARGALAAELAEVEAALAAEEDEDDEAALLAAEKAAAEAEAEQEGARFAPRPPATATLEGRGDLEDDFLAFANAPADGEDEQGEDGGPAPVRRRPEVVVGFDAPSDEGGGDEEEDDDDAGGNQQQQQQQRATDASPSAAAAYAELNSQFDRLMQEEYDDEDEEEGEEDDGGHRHRNQSSGGARTVGEELTPARLAALISGGVGGEETLYDDSDDDAYFDDEADGFGGPLDPAAAERAQQRRERRRLAREQALRELEGCAPVIPNAARVATLDDRDEDVLAATKARVAAAPRLRGDDEVDERGRLLVEAGEVGQGDEPLETLHVRRVRDRWDCESVLSLRTTASFQPSRIGDGSGPGGRRPRSLATASGAGAAGGSARAAGVVRLSQRTGLPAGYGPRAHLEGGTLEEVDEEEEYDEDEDEDEQMGDEDAPTLAPSSERRPRHETPEEKKARKGAAKAAQRAAREQKRQLKAAFREEAGKQRRQRAAVGAGSGASTFVIP